MALKLEIINPLMFDNWDNLVLSNKNYSFFHSSAWANVLHKSYHYTPLYFLSLDNKQLNVLMPLMEINSILTGRRGVSLPFSDLCEPIINDDINPSDVLDFIIGYGKKAHWKYIELRTGIKLDNRIRASESFLAHTLDLQKNEQNIFSKFRSSTKRNIKKAKKNEVKVGIFDSAQSIKEFYRMNCITRRRHGLPPQPVSFFDNIHNYIIKKNMGIVVLASYRKKIISGAIYFHFGKRAFYKYGASDLNYQYLRANNLVMWTGIKWYCQNGYELLHMGRTEGTKEAPMHYYRYDLRENKYVTHNNRTKGWHNKIFEKMPIPLARLVGSALYSSVG
jgi:lipid II:glycine glycyltransferase (peptidoglycan interpeptide bridge formation enzyme)